MNSASLVHQAKLRKWSDLIRDQQSSSLSVASWFKQQQLSKNKFYYWKRKLKDHYVKAQLPDILPITASSVQQSCTTDTTPSLQSSLILFINGISIEINENTSEHLLTKVIKAVRHA
jgi:hypothetical protein